jgi:aminoglycoside phosphotransferase family enzyme/predicted kinase
VEVYETHISWVFVVGERAYKVKKPVRLPFLDYSTLERRLHFCNEEVRLNRRLAPDVYLGVAAVTADFRIRGEGPPVEYAVEMVRLPHHRMLDVRLDRGEAGPADVEGIADLLASFHARAERADRYGGPAPVRQRMRTNLDSARRFLPDAWRDRIARDFEHLLERHRPLLQQRVSEGRIRDGHGDLHAGNVCLRDQGPVLYDCIDFEPAFRCGDTAGEVAFLAMDMERRGHWRLARAFVKRYTERSGDREGLEALLPLEKQLRACVRGLAESLRHPTRPQARACFRLAVSYGLGPFVVATCGLPGTGKSFLARHVAAAFDAEIVRSDLVRKELTGMAPTERWRGGFFDGPYAPERTEQTYATLRDRARAQLDGGRRVVIDATFATHAQRELLRGLGVACVWLYVDTPEPVVRARMERRAAGGSAVSDADLAVYRRARRRFERPVSPDVAHMGSADPGPALDAVVTHLLA